MTDIPKDIYDTALEIYASSDREGVSPSDIAQAILNERERCAKLCEETAMQTGWIGSEKTKRYSTYIAGEPAGGLGNTHEGMGYAALIREGTK